MTVENFHVMEDGTPQRDVQISNVRAPFSLAVVIDTNDATFAGQALEVFANSELCPVYSLNLWQPVRDGWYPVGPALAKLTGGTAADVGGADQAQAAAERIRIELQNMYVLQYPQSRAKDGKYRELRVDVQLNGGTAQLSTRYRAGYYAVNVP